MTRRVLLATGATAVAAAGGLVAAQLTGRLDDVADAVGVEPKPLPAPSDTRIVRRVASDMAVVLATVEATAAAHGGLVLTPFEAIGRAHLDAVGGTTASTDVAAPPADPGEAISALEQTYEAASTARAADVAEAVSPELVRVLASMSAGLAQCARAMRQLR